jgi:23S rRNA-/tRNA-specific pseudouridylate synthase
LAESGFPIIGDKKYYFSEDVYLDWLDTKNDHIDKMILPSQALHAKEVEFKHPFLDKVCNIHSKNDIMNTYFEQIKKHFK